MYDSKSNYNSDSQELQKWKKRFERERLQRKEAEILLEDKSRELYNSNIQLEKIVVERTNAYKTQLEETQKSAKLLAEYKKAVDSGFIVSKTDNKGKITYVNEAFMKISGYSKEELLGKSHNIVRHQDTSIEIYKDMWSTIKEKRIWTGELKNKAKSGKPYYVTSTIVPILDNKGDIAEFIGLRYDITDLIEAKEEVYIAQQAKETFFANMSHEIRTPLNAIIGFSDLLKKSALLEEDTKHINIINESAKSLLELINDILDFSKINSGNFTIEPRAYSLKDSIEHLIELLKPQAKKKGVYLNLFFDNRIPKCLKGDPNRLKQILTNLLSNAIKFTPKDEKVDLNVQLNITCQNDLDKVCLDFEVIDTGIGIDEHNIEKIFNPFAQSDNTSHKNHEGTGLGLTITSSLIEMMGGQLEVKSKINEGSKFFFHLEFEILDECELEKDDENIYLDQIELKGNVLVAEDNQTNQILINKLLKQCGLDISISNNGKEALAALEKKDFDLILMDINMPIMDGFEAIKEIKNNPLLNRFKNIPIVAVTANALVEDRKAIKKAGFDDYLSKPIDYNKLYGVLKKFVQIKEIKEEENIEKENSIYIKNVMDSFKIDKNTSYLLFDSFYDSCFQKVEELNEAISERKEHEIRSLSHNLKGTSLNLRLNNIGEKFKYIESNPLEVGLENYLKKALHELKEVQEELQKFKD